ncbi:hypothetical protein RQP46_010963 [Phenoliferia psychrophenolica]
MPPAGMAQKRIARELKELSKADQLPPGCRCAPVDASVSLFEWEAQIEGPVDSPYAGGVFDLLLTLPSGICLDILKGQWSPALSIVKVLLSISSLLADPNPHDPLVPDIAQRYLKDRNLHDKTAREWTKLYAIKGSEGVPGPSTKPKGPIEVITID